jgi:hypothetical protein
MISMLTITGSMYLDYSKRRRQLAQRRNNDANGRVRGLNDSETIVAVVWNMDRGEDGGITRPPA